MGVAVTTVHAKETIEAHTEKINYAPRETKAAITGLPMEDASDAWMNDDVGLMDSDSDDEMEVEKEAVKPVEEMVKETKPAIAGLPMEDASDAWMNDDFGTIDSEEEDSIESLEKEKKIIVEKIEEFKEKFSSKPVNLGFAGLPRDDVSDAWMNDDFVYVEDTKDEPSLQDKSVVTESTCYSPLCRDSPDANCYSSTCNLPPTSKSPMSDYDETDKETQMYAVPTNAEPGKVKEGRLSAIEEAKRFSCEEDDENQFMEAAEIVKEINICDDDESTSWAFVASKETSKPDEKVVVTRNLSTSSNPALIVEIIEKEPKHESMDPDGYKVVKGKTKTRDKRKSKEIPESSIEAIINQLDQPIDDKKVISHADVMSPVLSDEFEMIEQEDEKCISSKSEKVQVKEVHKQIESVHSSQDDDPWLAVKQEYTRKDSSTKKETDATDSVDYTIEVKVTTKETCLGRRLHDQDTTEWKMDVQCTQKNTMPDIIEGHDGQNSSITATGKDSKHTSHTNLSDKKFNSLPRLKTKALSPERLCLSPSWMRKDLSRTQSVESNLGSEAGVFGSVNRKFSDSRTSCFTSSAETLDEHDDDVYWRLKHKVKKKKRRNQSGPSDAKSRENNELLFASTKDSLEPLCPFVEPIIETKEESSIIVNSSINTIEEMESETTKTIDASIAKTSTAHTSMEKVNRKISTLQKTITNERTISMDMDATRKESVSPMQIDKQSSISVPLESVAESNMKTDISGNIKSVKTSVTKEEMHLANTPQLEIKIDQPKSVAAPSIVLQNEAESKMVGATEIIRATSPMLNQSRPQFKRQNSKEMQLAVEVQRPISFEKQTSLKAENVSDAWMNESSGSMDDDELDKELNEETKRKSWSSIAANVVSKVAKPKNESISRKTSSHETLIVQAEDDTRAETTKSVDKDGFEICVGKKEVSVV